MKLVLVIGPMFAGKSTFIFKKSKEFKKDEYLALKPSIDDRYGECEIVTHNKEKIEALNVKNLVKTFSTIDIRKYKCIFIDEGQFFDDLEIGIEVIDKLKFKGVVYVCGLNGDFKRKPIGQINNIIGRADDIKFLKGKCFNCENPSCFSLKIDNSVGKQIDVGGAEKYQPVCGNCYRHFEEVSVSRKSLTFDLN